MTLWRCARSRKRIVAVLLGLTTLASCNGCRFSDFVLHIKDGNTVLPISSTNSASPVVIPIGL